MQEWLVEILTSVITILVFGLIQMFAYFKIKNNFDEKLEKLKPMTAAEILKHENYINSKLQTYYDANALLARTMASMKWTGEKVPKNRVQSERPPEWETNAVVAKLVMFTDNPDVINAFLNAAKGGDNTIDEWSRFINLARKDMGYPEISQQLSIKYCFV